MKNKLEVYKNAWEYLRYNSRIGDSDYNRLLWDEMDTVLKDQAVRFIEEKEDENVN